MKIAQNFSTAYGGLAEHSKPALSAFSKSSLGQLFRLHCFLRRLVLYFAQRPPAIYSLNLRILRGYHRRLLPRPPARCSSNLRIPCGYARGFYYLPADLFLALFDLHFDLHFKKTFREMGVISAHIPLERHFPRQTKIPEKPGAKPLFGDFCCFIFCYSCI